MNHII